MAHLLHQASPASARKAEAPSSPWTYFRKKIAETHLGSQSEFEGLLEEVKKTIREDQLMNEQRLDPEVNWFFRNLGIHRYYFETNSAEEIAQDVSSLYSAKCLAHFTGGDLEIKLQSARQGRHVFVGRSLPGNRLSPCIHIEHMIEERYLGNSPTKGTAAYATISPSPSMIANKRFRIQTYRTAGPVAPDSDIHLRFYFLSEPVYPSGVIESEKESNLDKVSDRDFLKNLTPERKSLYQEVMNGVVGTANPVIRLVSEPNGEFLLIVAYHYQQTHNFLSGLTDLYHSYGLYSPRKFVDQFSNGTTIFSITLSPKNKEFTPDKQKQIVADANLIFILPRTALTPLFRDGLLNAQEYAYTYAVWKFAFHFLARQATEFNDIAFALKGNPVAANLLEQIKRVVRKEAYTEGRIAETLFMYTAVIKELYAEFARMHSGDSHLARTDSNLPQGSLSESELFAKIQKIVPGELDRQIFKAFLTFNKHTLKTNFYKTNKVALSFRFDASFLSKEEFPVTPYAIFFVVGPEFRGFHIRMRDIARGGIRLIKSHNLEAYVQNVSTVFQENYNLASTQDRKNKDIPEGGSKGTILLSVEHQDKGFEAFTKYIDSLIDLLLPEQSSMVDLFGKQEILFLGPDENTANYMDWASQHAKSRGYKFWKAFTTGKSTDLGGIPHDLYGMTTRSIHQYVLGTLQKLGLDESKCTKFQTGGPDGDLGSNEIKISSDKTVGIVDGSGVLYDPQGLDRTALRVLADQRRMSRDFDMKKLSDKGFFVDINDNDKTLPDGTLVPNGMDFRNNFHLNSMASSDYFVPCGGRPEAVNMSNVSKLMDESTKLPRYKFIVEGANLFFSQEARLILEKNGVIIFKDASANKGGVTSSSLEVLAALSFDDAEFAQHMNGNAEFYKSYVEDVQKIIEANARMEFNCIWSEHEKSGTSRCLLTDLISNKINELSYSISDSQLWDNVPLRTKVLAESFPKLLQQKVGLDKMLQRVPENYLRAMFGTYLASHYVYETGLSATPEFSFFNFINAYLH